MTALPLSTIEVDEQFNIRQTYSPIRHGELVQSIAEKGLLSPLHVWEYAPGKFRLIAGFRRMRALKEVAKGIGSGVSDRPIPPGLSWDGLELYVPVYVKQFSSLAAAKLANAAIDEGHEVVKRYDVAVRFDELLSSGEVASPDDLARETGMRRVVVNELVQCRRRLHPEILEAWRVAPSAEWEIPLGTLVRWSKLKLEHQLAEFRDYVPPIRHGKNRMPDWVKEASEKKKGKRTRIVGTQEVAMLRAMFEKRMKMGYQLTPMEMASYRTLLYILREFWSYRDAMKGLLSFNTVDFHPEARRKRRVAEEKEKMRDG